MLSETSYFESVTLWLESSCDAIDPKRVEIIFSRFRSSPQTTAIYARQNSENIHEIAAHGEGGLETRFDKFARARVARRREGDADNGKDFTQKRHMSQQLYSEVAITLAIPPRHVRP